MNLRDQTRKDIQQAKEIIDQRVYEWKEYNPSAKLTITKAKLKTVSAALYCVEVSI